MTNVDKILALNIAIDEVVAQRDGTTQDDRSRKFDALIAHLNGLKSELAPKLTAEEKAALDATRNCDAPAPESATWVRGLISVFQRIQNDEDDPFA